MQTSLELRTKLNLTQQAFASLLGMSHVSVNKWENGRSEPSGLGAVLLELLDGALKRNSVEHVLKDLKAASGHPVSVVRALVCLEANPMLSKKRSR